LSKSDGSVLRIRIGNELIIDVIIFDRIDQVLNQNSVNRIPVEVFARIVLRDYLHLCFRVVNVPCTTDKFADLVYIVGAVLTLVSNVAHDETLPSYSRDKSIQKEKHATVKMNGLTKQSLGFLVLEEGLEGIVNELSLIDVGHKGLKIFVIVID